MYHVFRHLTTSSIVLAVLLLGGLDNTPAFAERPIFPGIEYPTGTTPNSVALGDLDGNGTTDAVVANRNSSTTRTRGSIIFPA